MCVRIKFPYPVPASYTGARVDFTNTQDPPVAAAWISPSVSTAGGCRVTHTVQRGETLARIAAAYGTSASAVASSNGIKNPNYIRTGQALCIR
jgi:nucleoid-associated protein YgaU